MGAWGYGLQENDTAMDAIDELKKELDAVVQKGRSAQHCLKRVDGESLAVLGVADWLTRHGVTLDAASRRMVVDALREESTDAALEPWKNPAARRRVLATFAQKMGITLPRPAAPQSPPVAYLRVCEHPLSRRKAEVEDPTYGYKDRSGRFVIAGPFKKARAFRDGKAVVLDKKGWGFIRPDGTFLHPFRFDREPEFSEGLACVSVKGRYGFIDPEGQWVVQPTYDYADDFDGGIARVKKGILPKPVRYGLIDRKGQEVLPLSLSELSPFYEGLAAAYKGKKAGYIDRKGRLAIPFRFQAVGDFCGNGAPAQQANLWGLIDRRGRWIVKPQYTRYDWERRSPRYITFFQGDQRIRVDVKTGKAQADRSTEE